MKLEKLKKTLEKKVKEKRHPLRKEKNQVNNKNIDNIVVIGITGSRGKSTISYLVHEYLKAIGKKSILYSSICIDSPKSYIDKNQSCDIPIPDEKTILDIIEQAEEYEAEYLVLEVSERAIEKGLVKDIPFDIKVLTNLNPYHNKDFYRPEDYVKIKKSFFENSDTKAINIFGLTDSNMKGFLNEFISASKAKTILFGTKYLANLNGIDTNELNYMLTEKQDSLDGLEIGVHFKNQLHRFKTKMLLSHNAVNITCVLAIINSIKCYNEEIFNDFISNVTIPGREVVIKSNKRTIIIGMSLMPMLEELHRYKENNNIDEINEIKVVVGAPGLGYKTWIKEFSDEEYLTEQRNSRKAAMQYLKAYADYVCITESDSGATPVQEITSELKSYVEGVIRNDVIFNREDAIKKVINESCENDVIYISGRGNRSFLCNGRDSIKYINDIEVVTNYLKQLNWED